MDESGSAKYNSVTNNTGIGLNMGGSPTPTVFDENTMYNNETGMDIANGSSPNDDNICAGTLCDGSN